MRCSSLTPRSLLVVATFATLLSLLLESSAVAQLVPGAGRRVVGGGDDFEDPEWKYDLKWPKSSWENDGRAREPEGVSRNGFWYEGPKRGEPDYVKRVKTPPGGLPNSKGALLMKTLYSGVPTTPSREMQQDDLIFNLKRPIDVAQMPSVVVRVYMPPFEKWENRSGPTFGFRTEVDPRNARWSNEDDPTYWPGIFVDFESKDNGAEFDHAMLRVRADDSGGEYNAMKVTKTGWWTMGMSFTPDGRVHYYAKPGVGRLTAKDRLGSETPYSDPAGKMNTFFFDVCNFDDGRTWSTSWIIDDPQIYVARYSTAGR